MSKENKPAMSTKEELLMRDALEFHKKPTPGKIAVSPTKPLLTQRDLSLAYSPGVAYPCLEIAEDKSKAYDYTSKGNMVAVISNGTAVLGLGNLGAMAGKPVMEGKAVLFKRFAHIDAFDIEVERYTVDEFVEAVAAIGDSFGGINLEDIKSPECFEIEKILKGKLDIPVFHDDQHGTAIITVAGLMNACDVIGKKVEDLKIVMNGAGAAGIACLNLIKKIGVQAKNITLCDKTGVIYQGRNDLSKDDLKTQYAIDTKARTLTEALDGADVFIGLSAKDALSKDMIKKMARDPIVFAMANPDPEIKPEDASEVRPDAIVATGRSDYPNQVNNVMGFPYIFRGALDVQAREINDEMKIAAAFAIAKLAREPIPSEVLKAYPDRKLEYGKNYIIPTPFDPRLIVEVSSAVAKAAVETGVARKKIENWEEYRQKLRSYVNPTSNSMNIIFKKLQQSPKKVIFAEGEELEVIRSAIFMKTNGLAHPVLIGKEDKINEVIRRSGIKSLEGVQINNAGISQKNDIYTDALYEKLKRKGYLHRDCERMVKTDRNAFSVAMTLCGDGDCLVTGYTRGYNFALHDITNILGRKNQDSPVFGMTAMISDNQLIFVSDTAINEYPTSEDLVKIAEKTAEKVKAFGIEPVVAFISHSNFGSKEGPGNKRIIEAVRLLDQKKVDFEYDGEMTVNTALSDDPRKLYPFNRISKRANVLIMPGLHSATISTNLVLESSDDVSIIGPILVGLEKSAQIVSIQSDMDSIINMACLASIYS